MQFVLFRVLLQLFEGWAPVFHRDTLQLGTVVASDGKRTVGPGVESSSVQLGNLGNLGNLQFVVTTH